MGRFIVSACAALALAGCEGLEVVPPSVTPPAARLATGIAVTPKNFPKHTPEDVDEAFRLSAELGKFAVFIVQWGEYDAGVLRAMVDKSLRAGLTPIVGLSPTSLDRGRKDLDLPAAIRARAGDEPSFGHPAVREAFRKVAAELAALQLPYLCLATEINFLALQKLPEFLHFAALYKEAYREVKRISPATRVFVSFQWEWMRIVDAKKPASLGEHRKVIDIFRPELDLVALTTYPAPFHASPADLPADYYTWAFHHIPRDAEVMLMEVGWPTSGPGDPSEQEAFIRRLPALLAGLRVSVVAWALLHDVALKEFGADLNSVGLRYRDGRPKPGQAAFRKLPGRRD